MISKYFILFVFLVPPVALFGQNQNISGGNIFDGEPYLAIDPANPQHMVVAWMGYKALTKIMIKTKTTFDGGKSWSIENDISHTNSAYGSADPSVAFDNIGNLYLCYVDFSSAIDSGAVYTRKSTDGGLSWEDPVEVLDAYSEEGKFPIDRPWMSVDISGGVYNGNIYVTTMNPTAFGYIAPPYHPYFMMSDDAGNSFQPWVYLDAENWQAGSIIKQPMPTNCVSASGVFYAIYPSYKISQNLSAQYLIAASEDAGKNFSYHSVLESSNSADDPMAKKGYLIRSDPSNTNHLAFFFLSTEFGDIDVLMTESFDAGASWLAPLRVNDDPVNDNRMQDLVWADFDKDGDLVVSWRDRRNGTDSTYKTASEIWGAVRKKGATNFSSNFKISDKLVDYALSLAGSGNDFMCVKLENDTISAVWGDPRNGKLNIWFQRMTMDGTPLLVHQIASEELPKIKVYPNPAISFIDVESHNLRKVTVFNESGRVISVNDNLNGDDLLEVKLNNLPAGIYFVQVTTLEGEVTRKVVKQ